LRIDSLFKRLFNRRRATLADCTACGADFVHPVEWSPNDTPTWWILLRCGACGATREATVPDAEAERYDQELDRAEHLMRRAAERLSRERLAEQADSFATALELDLIGAEDFARPPGGA
jgi:DNA-binding response OmpR family regulator